MYGIQRNPPLEALRFFNYPSPGAKNIQNSYELRLKPNFTGQLYFIFKLHTKHIFTVYIKHINWWGVVAHWLSRRVSSEGSWFDFHYSHHVGTLGKSFARSCLWRIGVKLRHSIRAVSGAPLSSGGLEEAL